MVLLQRKLNFSKDPEGLQHFPGDVQLLQGGGVQMLISIVTHITCDFPGGGSGSSTPPPPSGSAHVLPHKARSRQILLTKKKYQAHPK